MAAQDHMSFPLGILQQTVAFLRILAIYSSIYHLHITSLSLDSDHFRYELEGLPHT